MSTITPPGPPRPSTPSSAPADPREASARATRLYQAMKGGAFGIGADREAIFVALDQQAPAEVEAIRQAYQDHYGQSLDAELKWELTGSDEARALALLSSDQPLADAIQLHQDAAEGFFVNPAGVYRTLDARNQEELGPIRSAFVERYGRTLDTVVLGAVYGDEFLRAQALLHGDRAEANAARIHQAIDGPGTTESEVFDTLEQTDARARPALAAAYEQRYGALLETQVLDDLGDGERERAEGLLHDDPLRVAAGRIRAAIVGPGTDEAEIDRALEDQPEAVRRQLSTAYAQLYKERLEVDLAQDLGPLDLLKAQRLMEAGRLSLGEQVYFSVEGWGTSTRELEAALQDRSPGELDFARAEYRRLVGRSMDADVLGDLTGRQRFEAGLALQGRPSSTEESLAQLRARLDYERGLPISNWIVDLFNDQGPRLEAAVTRAEAARRVAQGDGTVDPLEARRVEALIRYGDDDVETYRDAKDGVAEAAGTAATTVVAVGVAIGTGGTATPLELALVTGGSAVARPAAVSLVEGNWDLERATLDAGRGALDGALTVAGMRAGRFSATSALRARASGSFFEAGVAPVDLATGVEARRLLAADPSLRFAYGALEGGSGGAVGGGLGGGAARAVDERTWSDGVPEGLEAVATSAALGTAVGLGTGVLGGAFGARKRYDLADPLLPKGLRAPGQAEAVAQALADVDPQRLTLLGEAEVLRLAERPELMALLQHVDGVDLLGLDAHLEKLKLSGAARAEVIQAIADAAQDPKIDGVDDWVRMLLRTEKVDKIPEVRANLYNDLGELRVARQVSRTLGPGESLQVGRDVDPPGRAPTFEDREVSFDLVTAGTQPRRNIEVKTLAARFEKAQDLNGPVSEAISKVLPGTPGRREAAVLIELPPPRVSKGSTFVVQTNGEVTQLTPNGKVLNRPNEFEAFLRILNRAPKAGLPPAGIERLDAISIYLKDGTLLQVFERSEAGWSRRAPQ